MFIEKRYPIEGLNIATIELGDFQAEQCVVFIHGWLDNAASFKTVMEACFAAQPNWRWIAIDLPGHGLSDHKSAPNFYAFHDYIDDIYQILQIITANKPILVGHSLGALIASCYSAAFPEKVAGLVQIEGHAPISETDDLGIERLRKGVLSRQRKRRKPERGFKSLNDAIQLRSSVNGVASHLIAPVVERGICPSQGQESASDTFIWRHDFALQCESLYRMTPEQAKRIIQRIQCPHWLILAEHGFSHIADNYPFIANDTCTLVTIPGGHHCHLQYPAKVSELILGLVNKIETMT